MKLKAENIFIVIFACSFLILVSACSNKFNNNSDAKTDLGSEKYTMDVRQISPPSEDVFSLGSSAFNFRESLPKEYTCDGGNAKPPLTIYGTPKNTKSLALIMDDPDAPMGTFTHWIVWNIPSNSKEIKGVEGMNSFNENGYGGPCPPSGTHRYFFKLYSLDILLDIPTNSTKADLEKAMENHIIADTTLLAKYSRD
jgi:Raf kinase inhibitor-like YbhB/YbcL family protein